MDPDVGADVTSDRLPLPRPILRSRRTYLRPAERKDIRAFLDWLADADVGEGLANRAPWSHIAEERWFEDLQPRQGQSIWHFVICLRHEHLPIGFAALHEVDLHNGAAELGIGIGERSEWDMGYGTEAMEVLLDFGFGELRLERVYLHVFDFNARAMRVYERVGFTLEGTEREAYYRHGRYHDMHLMGILRDEWAAQDRARTWELE